MSLHQGQSPGLTAHRRAGKCGCARALIPFFPRPLLLAGAQRLVRTKQSKRPGWAQEWTYSFPGAGTAWACWPTCPAAGAWAEARRCSQTACRSWQSGAWTASETARLRAQLCAFWGWPVHLWPAGSPWTAGWMDSAKAGLERAPPGSYGRRARVKHARSAESLQNLGGSDMASFTRHRKLSSPLPES